MITFYELYKNCTFWGIVFCKCHVSHRIEMCGFFSIEVKAHYCHCIVLNETKTDFLFDLEPKRRRKTKQFHFSSMFSSGTLAFAYRFNIQPS